LKKDSSLHIGRYDSLSYKSARGNRMRGGEGKEDGEEVIPKIDPVRKR
jgi:hypothetical protein